MFCIGKGHHSNRHISRMHRGAIGVSATTLHLNSIRIKASISSTKSIWKGQHSNGHIWGMHRGAIGVSATTVDLLRLPYSALLPRLWAFFGIGVRCACLLRCYRFGLYLCLYLSFYLSRLKLKAARHWGERSERDCVDLPLSGLGALGHLHQHCYYFCFSFVSL